VETKSFWAVSDCIDHNTVLLHTFQKVTNTLEENAKYFSDSSAAQYNRKIPYHQPVIIKMIMEHC
jgi:hypothetical protein